MTAYVLKENGTWQQRGNSESHAEKHPMNGQENYVILVYTSNRRFVLFQAVAIWGTAAHLRKFFKNKGRPPPSRQK